MTTLTKPWRQGRLDHLCGAYALINALRLASPIRLSRNEGRDLLGEIVRTLDRQHGAGTTIAQGMSTPALRRALKLATRWARESHGLELRTQWPYYRAADAPIASILARISAHLREPHTAAIVAISGTEDHWTVIRKVSSSTIQLFDSAGQRYLRRSNLGGKNASHKSYRLWPASTALVTVSPLS